MLALTQQPYIHGMCGSESGLESLACETEKINFELRSYANKDHLGYLSSDNKVMSTGNFYDL